MMTPEHNKIGNPLRLRVHQVDTREVTRLNLAITGKSQSEVKAFYVERLAEDDCAFTVELQDSSDMETTVSALQQVIDGKRIEIVSESAVDFNL